MSIKNTPSALKKLRDQIDRIDEQILLAIADRQKISRQIGQVKAGYGLQVLQSARETEKQAQVVQIARDLGLDATFVERLYMFILADSRAGQEQV